MRLSRKEMINLQESVAYALDHDGTDTLSDAIDELIGVDEEGDTHSKIYSTIIQGAMKGVKEAIIKLNIKR